MKKIVIVDSTTMSDRLIHYFESTGFGKTIGMFDDFESEGLIKYNRPILGKIKDIPLLFKKVVFDSVTIGIGYMYFCHQGVLFLIMSRYTPIPTVGLL